MRYERGQRSPSRCSAWSARGQRLRAPSHPLPATCTHDLYARLVRATCTRDLYAHLYARLVRATCTRDLYAHLCRPCSKENEHFQYSEISLKITKYNEISPNTTTHHQISLNITGVGPGNRTRDAGVRSRRPTPLRHTPAEAALKQAYSRNMFTITLKQEH